MVAKNNSVLKITSEQIQKLISRIDKSILEMESIKKDLLDLLPKAKEKETVLNWYPLRQIAKSFDMSSQEFKKFLCQKGILLKDGNLNQDFIKNNRMKQRIREVSDTKTANVYFISDLGRAFLTLTYPELRKIP